jgi:dienelactone hydrolase
MRLIIYALLSFFLFENVQAKIIHKNVEYKDGNTTLEGYVAYDSSHPNKMPAVIVVHEWWGLNDYTKMRCDMLAKLGYVAFAADIYGKGNRATTSDEARRLSSIYYKD